MNIRNRKRIRDFMHIILVLLDLEDELVRRGAPLLHYSVFFAEQQNVYKKQ